MCIRDRLNNSLDALFILPEKWVKIRVESKKDLVIIHVIDSGLGIKEEIAEQMMIPFFTTKEIGKGTGLGLSISKGIVEAHNGKFYYQRENGHTSFVIELKKV